MSYLALTKHHFITEADQYLEIFQVFEKSMLDCGIKYRADQPTIKAEVLYHLKTPLLGHIMLYYFLLLSMYTGPSAAIKKKTLPKFSEGSFYGVRIRGKTQSTNICAVVFLLLVLSWEQCFLRELLTRTGCSPCLSTMAFHWREKACCLIFNFIL